MAHPIEEFVDVFLRRAVARESGNPGSPSNWLLRGKIAHVQYCRRSFPSLHGFIRAPITLTSPTGQETLVAYAIFERLGQVSRPIDYMFACHRVPAVHQALLLDGPSLNHGGAINVATVPLPHPLTPLDSIAVVQTISEQEEWNAYSYLGRNCFWYCATLLNALHHRASGDSAPTNPPPSTIVRRRFIRAAGATSESMRDEIDARFKALRTRADPPKPSSPVQVSSEVLTSAGDIPFTLASVADGPTALPTV
ncbi:hypothetical protein C8R45DRAFT_1176650 [Mycena sanguinolenta]|nr:hypothetical protein C8R45DRAFT_1176650 [Mycena sanguinolenta]